ncbi:c-type cytochrome [Halothiobacillus sp.]|uniref:c-type cytochrome n=1 Tax=Halothiobacillus sp. TaxID=1891311 RepID=UPI0026279DAA|nr:c-type cytochrome [Halothiobacillus sp.]
MFLFRSVFSLRSLFWSTGLAVMVVGSAVARAAPPPEAASCAACHGAQGAGQAAANFPRLAGLPASYLAEQLHLFASGQRQNAIMSGMAKPLSSEQIKTLADYYSGLPVSMAAPAQTVPADLKSRGEQLAMLGDWKAGIPACFRCHGPGGVGVAPAFPALTGQSATYLDQQITAWKNGTRSGDPQGLMHTIALRMSDADTKAVTAWLAAQKPEAAVMGKTNQAGGAQ